MKIGICIPCSNSHSIYLKRLIENLERQTKPPDIISISISEVDMTNFTDPRQYMKSDSIKIVVRLSGNKNNTSENRNMAAKMIYKDVDILSFFDADDLCHCKRTEYITKSFESDIHAVVHNYEYTEGGPNEDFLNSEIGDLKLHTNVLDTVGNTFPSSEKMGSICYHNGHVSIRSCIFENHQYNEDWGVFRWEDSEYNNRLVKNGIKISYIENKLSNYIK